MTTLALEPQPVRVLCVDVAALESERLRTYESWLAAGEVAKADRMATDALRAEYVASRALSRWALTELAPDVAPSAWQFERTQAGRPYLVGPRVVPVEWNLSHAGGLVVCAIAAHPVGVDVEPRARGVELVGTAAKMFSPAENAELALLEPDARADRAVELWTLKEAYLKARGGGISVRLTRFGVSAHGAGRYALGDVAALDDDPRDWQLEIRDTSGVAGPCVVAVAIRRGDAADVQVELVNVVPA